jgi:hypothetical protein
MARPMFTVYIKNQDPKKSDLEVITIDNYASDPVESDPVKLKHDKRHALHLTIDNGFASFEWTATAKDGRQGGPITESQLKDNQEVPVGAR